MHSVILQMTALIACGVGWRLLRPGGLDADSTRLVLTSLVYYLLLPALVIQVLWKAPLGISSLGIAASAAVGVLSSILLSSLICRSCRHDGKVTGAVVLAASFPNVTYMGLPVLVSLFGDSGRSIAIQYDLFACTPLLLTVGILIARLYGKQDNVTPLWQSLLRVPPLWAALAGVMLNLSGIGLPAALDAWLEMLAAGVIPLMLFSLGLSLRWDTIDASRLPTVIPIVMLQLFIAPLIVWGVAQGVGLDGMLLKGTVMEAAMPSMVIGIVLCDRYGLDTGLYAAAVTLTTLLSLFTLPMWSGILS
ncbi:MAG: AEC family transporter [Gammaproteobacteria bacterium]|nr:AEC family transporter [Gammaproteobacteria bacterium]